ncbi:HPr family phosphocarrier protein [Candidatus Neptunichlamydia sp. REUL1]|uniref:HPr family phosphocarrier protein n=1 Tax=Candidatus Neptunichlamydia sp. REUL1 TaxID=3064277 RepID=UPI00292E1C12|nr:HPr family phosphocarrier protein [Candidatus Neptunochlamydia sp. REUL1]
MEDKVEATTKVKNKLGLHVRPATQIAKILQKRKAKVTLTYKGQSVNARSIMSIMILAAPKNAQLKIEVEGSDARLTLEELLSAFTKKFGEDG